MDNQIKALNMQEEPQLFDFNAFDLLTFQESQNCQQQLEQTHFQCTPHQYLQLITSRMQNHKNKQLKNSSDQLDQNSEVISEDTQRQENEDEQYQLSFGKQSKANSCNQEQIDSYDEDQNYSPLLQAENKEKQVDRIKQIVCNKQINCIEEPAFQETKMEIHQDNLQNQIKSSNQVLYPNSKKKKKRGVISKDIIQQLKTLFQQYNQGLTQPNSKQLTFRSIANLIKLSATEVKHLFDQYTEDPLFINRLSKLWGNPDDDSCQQIEGSRNLTYLRLQFLKKLIKTKGMLTQPEIMKEMSQVEHLHQLDKNGQKIPISRKMVQHLMKIGNIQPKSMQLHINQINSSQSIINRFKYAKRYLQLTEDKFADICFLGQFSFSSNISLSSCPPLKRDSFCQRKPYDRSGSHSKQSKPTKLDQTWSNNFQYMLTISINGLVHYQLFNNMFQQIIFGKTIMQVGKAIAFKAPNIKKYLILQTSFFHKKIDLHALQQHYPIKVIFLPPSTPMLNPTEYLFNDLKQIVKSKTYKQKRSMRSILIEQLQEMKDKNMSSYYNNIRPYLELALSQKPFK